MAVHRCQHHAHKKGKGCYLSVFPLLKLPDIQIALIEIYPCNNKDELRAREQYYMDANRENLINRQDAVLKPTPIFVCRCGFSKMDIIKKFYNTSKPKNMKGIWHKKIKLIR
jgi:hypothetical protein